MAFQAILITEKKLCGGDIMARDERRDERGKTCSCRAHTDEPVSDDKVDMFKQRWSYRFASPHHRASLSLSLWWWGVWLNLRRIIASQINNKQTWFLIIINFYPIISHYSWLNSVFTIKTEISFQNNLINILKWMCLFKPEMIVSDLNNKLGVLSLLTSIGLSAIHG